jgi:hypothetical protein
MTVPEVSLERPVRLEYREGYTLRFSHKYSWPYFQNEAEKIQPSKAKFSHKYSFPVENNAVFLSLLPTSILPHVKPNALLLLAEEFFVEDVRGTFVDP